MVTSLDLLVEATWDTFTSHRLSQPDAGGERDAFVTIVKDLLAAERRASELREGRTKRHLFLLLERIADKGVCRGCGADIYWVKHLKGAAAPYTPEGLNHFADCPNASEFRKEGSKRP